MNDYMYNLKDVSVGDKLILRICTNQYRPSVQIVENITKSKVIVLSGMKFEKRDGKFVSDDPKVYGYLRKPYDLEEIQKVERRMKYERENT